MIRLFIALSLIVFSAGGYAAEPGIEAEAPWVRVTFGQSTTTAAYVTLVDRSGKGDTLTGIETADGSMAHIHETVTEGDTIKMRMVHHLTVPPNGRVELGPASGHIMIMGLKRPLKAGETLPLKLRFARSGDMTVTFQVRAQ